MQFAHNGYYKGSTPLGLNLKQFQFIFLFYNKIYISIKNLKGIWSSLVYGVRLENEYFFKSREFKSHSARIILFIL